MVEDNPGDYVLIEEQRNLRANTYVCQLKMMGKLSIPITL